jgi:hypothetical protein
MANIDNVVIQGARIIFRNFKGAEGMYNREGDRNFAVCLDTDIAEQMAADGWNIKYLKPRDETEEAQAYLSVSVNYKGRAPRVSMISSRGQTLLDEEAVDILDWVDIANVDLVVRPYEWAVNGKTGVKAYLKTLVVTIDEDELELKYANVPMASGTPDLPTTPEEEPDF